MLIPFMLRNFFRETPTAPPRRNTKRLNPAEGPIKAGSFPLYVPTPEKKRLKILFESLAAEDEAASGLGRGSDGGVLFDYLS